jgi:hypothetical protein
LIIFGGTDHFLPDQGTARHRSPVVYRQGKTPALAISALSAGSGLVPLQWRSFLAVALLPIQQEETLMKLGKLALTTSATAVVLSSLADRAGGPGAGQGAVLSGPGVPHRRLCSQWHAPWANGYVDYLKLVNARGGINGVKISFEECETGYATDRGVECYERLKGKHGGATVFQPCRLASPLR